jgi:predicted acylesterase/phospholipase RssA
MRPAGFGIALSGGGFRASFFHLGVLARLAEIDALRSMEILSTVSGGSILGGALYLKLKRLLESKEDGEIRRQDYLQCLRGCPNQRPNARAGEPSRQCADGG